MIENGIFETTLVDFQKKLSWWKRYSLQKKRLPYEFITILYQRYLIKLEWLNHEDNHKNIEGIKEDILLRNLKESWVCILEKTSDHAGVMILGGEHRLLFKRPLSSLKNPTLERDECINFLKSFFPDIQVTTYKNGFTNLPFPDVPSYINRYRSYYGFYQKKFYKLGSLLGLSLSFILGIALFFNYQKLDLLKKDLSNIKPEVSFLKKNYQEISFLKILSDLNIIHYFKVKINAISYDNHCFNFQFRGPKKFEKSLFPVLKIIYQNYRTSYYKNCFTIKLK